jgi:hypothetical protein
VTDQVKSKRYAVTIIVDVHDVSALRQEARRIAEADGYLIAEYEEMRDAAIDPIYADLVMVLDRSSMLEGGGEIQGTSVEEIDS